MIKPIFIYRVPLIIFGRFSDLFNLLMKIPKANRNNLRMIDLQMAINLKKRLPNLHNPHLPLPRIPIQPLINLPYPLIFFNQAFVHIGELEVLPL
jgi:hypothetical protein